MLNISHTIWNSFYLWSKTLSLKINIFWLKNDGKSGLESNILKFHGGLQRYLLTCQANSALLGRFFYTGQQRLWRPSWNLKTIFSRQLFSIIFKPKMVSNLRKNFLCIVWYQKPTVYFPFLVNKANWLWRIVKSRVLERLREGYYLLAQEPIWFENS